MGNTESKGGVGPLARLMEAGAKALALMRARGPLVGRAYKDWQAAADEFDLAMGKAQPLANQEQVGRGCVGCGSALENLPELGAYVLLVAEQMEQPHGAKLEQVACHVAGFCSVPCWVGNAPASFPGGSAFLPQGVRS